MESLPLVVLLLGFSSIYKYLVATALRLWAILRSLRSLRVSPWITASRYPPTSLRLLVIQRMTGATWRRLFSICLRRPCRGPLAAVRLGEQGWRASPFVPAPTRSGCPLRFSVKGPCPRPSGCGPHQPLDPAPSRKYLRKARKRTIWRFSSESHAYPTACAELIVVGRLRLFPSGAGRQGGNAQLSALLGWPTTSAARRQQVARPAFEKCE